MGEGACPGDRHAVIIELADLAALVAEVTIALSRNAVIQVQESPWS